MLINYKYLNKFDMNIEVEMVFYINDIYYILLYDNFWELGIEIFKLKIIGKEIKVNIWM
jgi:hypothetical protein